MVRISQTLQIKGVSSVPMCCGRHRHTCGYHLCSTVALTLLKKGRSVSLLVPDTGTWDYVQLIQFFKLLPVSFQIITGVDVSMSCPFFIGYYHQSLVFFTIVKHVCLLSISLGRLY